MALSVFKPSARCLIPLGYFIIENLEVFMSRNTELKVTQDPAHIDTATESHSSSFCKNITA